MPAHQGLHPADQRQGGALHSQTLLGSGPTLGPTRPRRSAASSSAPMCSSIIASDHTRLAYGLEGENGRTWTTDLL